MKKYTKFLFISLTSLTLLACNISNATIDNEKPHLEKKDSIITDYRIDLDSLLSSTDYLTELEDSVLTMCCYQELDITPFINLNNGDTSWIKISTEEVKVIRVKGTELYKYFNSHPDLNRDDLVKGTITSNEALTKNDVQIGMKKNELLERLFRPSHLFSEINVLTIIDSEEENFTTTYSFTSDQLSRIEFGSDYDWIK